MKLILVAGARPNFMKVSPIIRALQKKQIEDATVALEWKLVHTGQHYDHEMSEAFFQDLAIPQPDYFLDAGSGSHAVQTAKVMVEFEKVCKEYEPDIVIVVGDVNSTLACSIVAKKLLIRIAHVEAGLRSFDLQMPEEINRMVTDSITDYFFATEQSAVDNLLKEGKETENIHFVGHVMIDNLLFQLGKLNNGFSPQPDCSALKKRFEKYAFLTLHRPSNVDTKETLSEIMEAMNSVASTMPVIFPVHPRTKKMLSEFRLPLHEHIFQLPPLSFKDSLYLWKDAQAVFTDSGGLQEETTALGVPCLTLRDNTERPITVELGTNCLVGNKKEEILSAFRKVMSSGLERKPAPPKWDGKAAERIVRILTV